MLAENKQAIQKDKEDTIADNLDNKVSFKAIISTIESKKKRSQKTLNNYIYATARRRGRPADYFCFSDFLYPGQPRNLFSEEWDGGLNSGFFERFSHKSLMPWMITRAHNIDKTDPITDLLCKRHEWNTKWSCFKKSIVSKGGRKHKWFDDDVLYCPKFYVDMAVHLDSKPDPFFEDTYNWYYAGNGNLLLAQVEGADYLIYSELNCLFVSPFFKDSVSIDYGNTAAFICSQDENIMETIHSQHIIALRTKCKVIILKMLISQEVVSLEKVKDFDSELPLTSISFDEFHKNIMYVTTLDCKLTIINLDRMTGRSKKLRGKFPTLVDNWSCVIGAERGYFTHVTKNSLTLYDKRTNEPFQRWKSFKFISDIETCSIISAVKYCPQKPLLYVGTDHHLFLMDMRCGKTKNTNVTPIQRWTHGMMCAPTYMDICKYDHNSSKELLCLSSQWVEDMCLVSNYSDKLTRTGEINGLSMPYRPPSIMQTFNEAKKKELCCDIYKPLYTRLCTSISGLSIVDKGDNISILLQNSLGDVSCHTLYPEHMFHFIEDDSMEKLHEWSKDLQDDRKPFEVSHIIDIQPLWKALYKVPDDFILGRNHAVKPRMNFRENEIYEAFSNDVLDPEFLEVWKEQDEAITLDKTGPSNFFVDTG